MKYLLFLAALFLVQCSEESKNPVLAVRDRTPLEEKVLGTWQWAYAADKDQITFNADLSFSGEMNGAAYNGTFTLAGDSILNLVQNINIKGVMTTEYYAYKLQTLDSQKLIMWSSNRAMRYLKVK
jgi:hypothetical protein